MDKPDFDPTHLLDGWRPDGGESAAMHRQRLRGRGYEMNDVEDIELPELTLPETTAPAPLDSEGLSAVLQAAARLGARTPARDLPPELELPSAAAPRSSRLLTQWQPGAWIGVCRRLAGAGTGLSQGASGPVLDRVAPQWLLALWPPQELTQPLLSRWPQAAALRPLELEAVGDYCLAQVPGPAPLWLCELDPDWALLAEIVRLNDPALRPEQLELLREFVEAERLLQFERLNQRYRLAPSGMAWRQGAPGK